MTTNNTPAPCRVRIIKCSFEQGWYASRIGEEFDVDAAEGQKDYIVWEDYINKALTWRHIQKADCIVVPLTKEETFEMLFQDFLLFSVATWDQTAEACFRKAELEAIEAQQACIENVPMEEKIKEVTDICFASLSGYAILMGADKDFSKLDFPTLKKIMRQKLETLQRRSWVKQEDGTYQHVK